MKPWRSTNTFGNFKRKKKLTKVNIDTNKPEGYNVTTVHHHHHSFLTAFFLFLFLKALSLSSLLKRDHQPAHGSARKAHRGHAISHKSNDTVSTSTELFPLVGLSL